jgi:transposase
MHLIQDTVFERIMKILNQIKGVHRGQIARLRAFIEAIFYMSKSGCQWRLLPYYYGKWRSIHKRFKSWVDRSIWQQIFDAAKDEPDMEFVMIDSTVVRAHACAAGYGKDSQEREALGRSRGGFSTKIHAVTDALGNPLRFSLTGGHRNDITQAIPLTKDIENASVIADKGYDSDAFVEHLESNNCEPEIPPRKNRNELREYDKDLYEERHKIELFFGKIKHFRRVFSRFDKSAASYLSYVYFVGTLIWLR